MKRIKGLTLLEIMIAIVIAVIVLFVAVPSLKETKKQVTEDLTEQSLLQQLRQDQQIAVANMTSVAVCLSDDGKVCLDKSSMMVCSFIDNHNDGVIHDESQKISCNTLQDKGVLHLRSYPKYRSYLLVLPLIQSASDNGTFWFCDKDKTVQWAVAVSQLGEARALRNPSSMDLAC